MYRRKAGSYPVDYAGIKDKVKKLYGAHRISRASRQGDGQQAKISFRHTTPRPDPFLTGQKVRTLRENQKTAKIHIPVPMFQLI